MPAHWNSSIRSQGSGKVFKANANLSRVKITVGGTPSRKGNRIEHNGFTWGAEDVLGWLKDHIDNGPNFFMPADAETGPQLGCVVASRLVDGFVKANVPELSHKGVNVEEVVVMDDDGKGLLHIYLSHMPTIKAGELFTVEGVSYVAQKSFVWYERMREFVKVTNDPVTTDAMLAWLCAENVVIQITGTNSLVSSQDPRFVAAK